MKKKNRRSFTAEFKARVALEAAERERERLERKIGQLTMEVDWLAKKSKELGL